MATTTTSLDEEASERLKAHERAGESFSEVVKRLAGERSWHEVAGVLDSSAVDELEAAIDDGRARSRGLAHAISSGWTNVSVHEGQ